MRSYLCFLTVLVLYKSGAGGEGGVVGKDQAGETVEETKMAEIDFKKNSQRFYKIVVEE